ncbi:MAG TPA: hypothetical protein VGJ83_07820 [Gemmatimonadales bacterium]
MLHAIAAILAVTIPWQAPRRAQYVVLQPLDRDTLPIVAPGGARPMRQGGATIHTSARRPEPPPPPPPAADTTPSVVAYDPDAQLVPAPRVGDGRLWVSPRPALPGPVADVLYGPKETRDTSAVVRLRVMVDSLNEVVDSMQRIERRPTWTVGGGESGIPKFGIDSQFIHVAGIKIPTAALALIGNLLPQGNFDEAMRARQLEGMRQDLLQAAARAQTLHDFQRYVRELRERKQEERDAERRRQQRPDTVKVVP